MKDKLHQSVNKALFRFWVETDVVLVEDLRGEVSVTVDALQVYKYVEKQLGSLEGKTVIWQDLMGEWDGMEMENGEILFFPIGCRCHVEAIEKVNQMEALGQRSDHGSGE
ncbi:hypothetical protein [Telluribacter sp. SYSU D00476]|uniref:hypothetical protein n=1 Tax=Telluribacter sp. SYSU D00476 TaxID=2811430 RepID=UPI001FF4C495|nr:hypothetical protein [Telluribacter sp. SYSU D00476]